MSTNENNNTKELSFQCAGGVKGLLDVNKDATLEDVRKQILEELDDDMIPPDFAFHLKDIRISKKQETKKRAWDLIDRQLGIKSKRGSCVNNTSSNVETEMPPAKYQKTCSGSKKSPKPTDSIVKNQEILVEKTQFCPNISHNNEIVLNSLQEEIPQHEQSTLTIQKDSVQKKTTTQEIREVSDLSSANSSKESETDEIFTNATNPDKTQDVNMPEEIGVENELQVVKDNPDKNGIVMKGCKKTLKSIDLLLQNNPLFCNNARREEWRGEISQTLLKTAPSTVFGVLGNTGVGKSSLLNALLDEASVLPTSGSRGCTATVVELRYNIDLLAVEGHEVSVYKGDIEFMSHNEWMTELRILVDECCTQEKRVYQRQPDPRGSAEAAAAWAKIDEVYGKGTMIRHKGESSNSVFNVLSNNYRLQKLLTPSCASAHPYNIISVQEGKVISGSNKAKYLLGSYQNMNTRMKRSKKDWAEKFRAKINSYVYRKGNGRDAQTWPLIRKVVLYGPWACLSTGASLVDLPGVRDANAARAKVAENYLQNCNQIWIVAPIKRAVDDGSAKELLGEQFKRRLLMDGQYGNVSFICTQTDDCETTEIMRDHVDVAQNVEGRWEKMVELVGKIRELEKRIEDLKEEVDDLESEVMYQEQVVDKIEEDNSEQEVDIERMMDAQRNLNIIQTKLKDWRDKNSDQIDSMQHECKSFQSKLKTLCAIVRNEYSTKCLQEDFKEGLKALVSANSEDDALVNNNNTTVIPEDYIMPVHCISSNDYLKMQGIKPQIDGSPATFLKSEDTQIPSLQKFVHEVTACFRKRFVKDYVNDTSDLLDRVKLLAGNAYSSGSSALSFKSKRTFEREVSKMSDMIKPLTEEFSKSMKNKVRIHLQPAFASGAQKGIRAAMPICSSWGSKSRRSTHHRDPDHNGLYYQTYNATIRRKGVYTSASAGGIDLNQELCDPMEKEFSVNWQHTMDNALNKHLAECEIQVQKRFHMINHTISCELVKQGVEKNQIRNMSQTAARGCYNAIKVSFSGIRKISIDTQRNLNRSLLPTVQSHMAESYDKALGVQQGPGVFNRIKYTMHTSTNHKVQQMFNQSIIVLVEGIDSMVKNLVDLILKIGETIRKHLEDVYSILWDDTKKESHHLDPKTQEQVRNCRDSLLPILNQLYADISKIQDEVGITREAPDLDVLAISSLEDTLQKKIAEAKVSGEVIDLCDSDEEIEAILSKLPPAKPMINPFIKKDPGVL